MPDTYFDSEPLNSLIAIAIEAGDRIMEVYNTDFSVDHKDDNSPLTAADLAAHQAISKRLHELEPNIPLLSEESALTPFAERSGWARYWLVDPLDGTREFVKRNGEFTVNIALIEGHRAVMGVVYVPVTGVCYFAGEGSGAWKLERNGIPQRIGVRPIPDGRLTVVGSRSHSNETTEAFMTQLGDVERIAIGSALKICLVAEGRADVYPRFGPTSEWDTAAAQCVVEQAGGMLTDASLQQLQYNAKDSLLNPSFLVFGDASFDWRRYIPENPG